MMSGLEQQQSQAQIRCGRLDPESPGITLRHHKLDGLSVCGFIGTPNVMRVCVEAPEDMD